jgi:hypothetical protein
MRRRSRTTRSWKMMRSRRRNRMRRRRRRKSIFNVHRVFVLVTALPDGASNPSERGCKGQGTCRRSPRS